MKISVALCTYNGENYLLPQLESITQQTILPDEVVICDDVSTDKTIDIIERFRLSAPFSVRLYRNEQNLGSTKNFEKAISLSHGDIIFLSDQDDLWLPEKIQKIMSLLEADHDVEVVFTDGYIVNNNLEVLDTLWNKITFTPQEQALWKNGHAFEQLLLYNNRATGATMAIRRSFLSHVLPFEVMNFWIHDGIITLKAALYNKILYLNEKLILYREHANQQLGFRGVPEEQPLQSLMNKIKNGKWINKDEFLQKNYEDLKVIRKWVKGANLEKVVEKKMQHFEKRLSATNKNGFFRPFVVLPEWINGNYKKFSCGSSVPPWILVVKDLLGK